MSFPMHQILFEIPVYNPFEGHWTTLPIYGFGMMLFLAFLFCTWLASRLAKKDGIAPQHVQDLALWLVVFGIIGARITFMIQYEYDWRNFYKFWDGGIVFYGSAIGGVVGYFGAYYFFLRKYNVSTLKMADVIAPCAALGLCIGRFGCLLNGCCYGNVACPDCPSISFPLSAYPRFDMVRRGYQTAAGFTTAEGLGKDKNQIARVEPNSPAAQAGLKEGDIILEVNGDKVDPHTYIGEQASWPRSRNVINFKVRHLDGTIADIPDFSPQTLGLHPTQLYESISMALLCLLLLAYLPYRRYPGELMVLFMLGYAMHRFLNESLRDDTPFVAFHMTLSQNISVVVFIGGLLLALWIWLQNRPVARSEAQVPVGQAGA
jgi:phosphatidylglycerol:prolipoprotein diacylglycerol transferase